MKHIKTYNNFKINENFDYQLINENKLFNFYRKVHDKTVKKLGLNLYFAATYTWGVTMLYPIVDALIKNSDVPNITPEQIVLLTLFSITQIINMATDDVKKLKEQLETDNLLDVAKKVEKSLLSIQNIFKYVAKSFGTSIDAFIDMIAYVALGLPFTSAIVEIISKDGLDIETLPHKAMVFGAGAAIYTLKSMVETIVNIIKNKANIKKQI